VWLLSSLLITARAVAIGACAFIVLGAIQIVATALITMLAARSKDTPCPVHRSPQPAVRTARGAGTPGIQPGSRRPASRPPSRRPVAQSATSAGHGGALRCT
jgi:hypothetical protein